MAGSIWFIMMSESVLLGKVQGEMSGALECLRKKQESEIQDLLYFLRQSQISADPMSSWEGAKNFITKLHFPAMTMSRDFNIVKANKYMTNLLGRAPGALNGVAGHRINDAVLMSTISEMYSQSPGDRNGSAQSRYAYIHKSGKKITGLMCATKVADIGYFIIFYPDSNNMIDEVTLMKILSKTRPDVM